MRQALVHMGKKTTSLLFFLVFVPLLIPAQQNRYADSLIGLLKTKQADTVRAKLLNDLVWEVVYNNPSQAEGYGMEELSLSQKAHWEKGIFDSYTALGSISYLKSNLGAALDYHKKALEVSQRSHYLKGLMIANSNIGVVYKDLGNHLLETQYCLASLKTAETLRDSARMSAIYSNLGLAYQAQKSYEEAITYNRKALSIREKRHDTRGIAACYINIASALTDQTKFNEALDFQLKALALAAPLKDNYLLAKCYSNLGLTYKDLNKYEEALNSLKAGLMINEALGSKASQAALEINIGELYQKMGKNPEALSHFEKALKVAKEIGHKKWQMEAYAGLSNVYEKLNDPAKAHASYYQFAELRDSMANESYNKDIANMRVLYDTEKKESEITSLKQGEEIKSLQLLEQQTVLQERKFLLAASAVVIIALILAGYFYFSRQKINALQKQQEAVRQAEESERVRMAKDIHDDLGSGLSKIKFMTELVSSKSDNSPEIKTGIQSISETSTFLVENMRDLIWALNPENTKLENMIARIREYSTDYLGDFPIQLTINISESIPDMELSKEAHRNIFFIVKEVLQNIVKHALATQVNLSISLRDNQLKLMLTDNGKGYSTDLISPGEGLNNIRQRAGAIKGTVEMTSVKTGGTCVCLLVTFKAIEKA